MEVNLPYSASYAIKGLKAAAGLLPPGDLGTFILGAIFVLLAIFIIFLAKRVLENLIIGTVGFLLLKYFFGLSVPLIPGLIVSILFGLGGLGVLLILHFFGLL